MLSNPVLALWRSLSSYTNRAPIPLEQRDRLQHYTIFLLLYMLAIGGEGGSKNLWMYTYPLFLFFLLGTKEGLVWSSCSLVVAAILLPDPLNTLGVFSYHPAFKLRFLWTFVMVSFIAFWFQYLRHSYFVKMEDRQAKLEQERIRLEAEVEERLRAQREKEALIQELQTALDQVKTLSGMIPICSNCRKIRDDEGFWDQIEGYLARRSDAQFSHGICPDCLDRLYPEYRRSSGGP